MTLDESQYSRLLPFRKVISHVAQGGNTSKMDAFWMCYQIKLELTGIQHRTDCSSCAVELLQELEIALTEYEVRHGAQ